MSDTSDDASTVSPMVGDLQFGPTTMISNMKMACSAPAIAETEKMNGIAHGLNDEYDAQKESTLEEMHRAISSIHDKISNGIPRSFGDDLEEMFPFIDSGSRKNSNEEIYVHQPKNALIRANSHVARNELKSISVQSVDEVKRRDERRIIHKSSLRENRNGSMKRRVTDVMSLPPRGTAGRANGKIDPDIPKIHKSMENNNNNLNSNNRNHDTYSFSDSVRVYKNQLWKRVTTGWKTRPSRQLVKKATKQMRREHKATVTLAVVLAVFLFCWLPFFSLHLANSICILSGSIDGGCIGMLPLFLATWLGYVNSSLNPLIYTVFDQRFRSAFRNIVSCGFRKK